jgi:membrane fusion protein (multidrug efflux system)
MRSTTVRSSTLTLLALVACGHSEAGPERASPAGGVQEREARLVRTEPLEQREMVRVLETTTVVESRQEVPLFARVSGIATEVLAEEGDRVEAGAVLARLERDVMELAVRDSEVALEEAKQTREKLELAVPEFELRIENADRAKALAESEFARAQRLSSSGSEGAASLISEQELERARNARDSAIHEQKQLQLGLRRAELDLDAAATAVKRAEVALDRARLDLAHTDITAPVSGVVASRSIRVGTTVNSGEAAFVVTQPGDLRAVFYRPQRELSLFHGGTEPLPITASTEALPGSRFEGWIERTSPTIDPESGSFRVTAKLSAATEAESDARLLPGMLVRLRIVTDRHPKALVVPKRALLREGDQTFVYVVSDGAARRADVKEGYTGDDHVEVLPVGDAATELLGAGIPVIVVGNRDLEDGLAVEIDAGPEAAAEALAEGADASAGEASASDADASDTTATADGGN